MSMTTTPGAMRIKETLVTWRRMTVVTEQSFNESLLRRYSVFVANDAGVPVSLTAQFATEAAADLEHQKLVSALTTGTLPKVLVR